MRDQIFVKDYRKSIEVGAFVEERNRFQDLLFHVIVDLAPQNTITDEVDNILSYDVIVEAIDAVLAEKRFNLLETIAEEIASRILTNAQALCVDISVEKLGRIDGRLGARIIREGGQKAMAGNGKNAHLVFSDAQIPDTNDSVVIVMKPEKFDGKTEFDRRIFALQEAARAWALSRELKLPVVDTKVEALALIARGENFIRAYGKQPFDLIPPLNDFSPAAVLKWHRQHLSLE